MSEKYGRIKNERQGHKETIRSLGVSPEPLPLLFSGAWSRLASHQPLAQSLPALNSKGIFNRVVYFGGVAPETSLAFNGVDVPVLADGSFVLGLGRDAPAILELEIADVVRCAIDIKSRQYRISRVEGVPQRTVTPPEEQLARIRSRDSAYAQQKRSVCNGKISWKRSKPGWLGQSQGE